MVKNLLGKGGVGGLLVRGSREPFRLPGALSDESRILAIGTPDLTDLLFHAPLMRGIRSCYPGSRIDFLLPEGHTPLVVPSGLARQCLVYGPRQLRSWTPGYWALLRALRRGDYDVALVLSLGPHPELETAALASGARLRLGLSHPDAWPGLNFEYRPRTGRYRGDWPLAATAFLGLDGAAARAWPLPPDRLRRMQQLVHFNKPRKDELLVGADPGLGKAGHGISLENLHFLLRQLSSQLPCRTVALAGPEGAERRQELTERLGGAPPGLPQDTLLETVLLLAQCDLFLAGNTDLFHFAVAQGVATVGLFTSRDGAEWDPGSRASARILRVSEGKRVDIDTLMAAVEAVTGGGKPAAQRRRPGRKPAGTGEPRLASGLRESGGGGEAPGGEP